MTTPPRGEQKPENPHQTWAFKDEVFPAPAPPLAGYRPGGLTAVCIIAIVLGGLGVLVALTQVAMNLAGNQIQQWQMGMGGGGLTEKALEVQAEFNTKMNAITNRYRLVNLIVATLQLFLAGALVLGGAWCLGLKEKGRKLLWAACGLAVLFELGRSVPYVMMQLESMPLMEEYFPRLMEASMPRGQADQAGVFMEMMMRFSKILGWVVFGGWLVLKLVFFGVAFSYLGRSKIKALFSV